MIHDFLMSARKKSRDKARQAKIALLIALQEQHRRDQAVLPGRPSWQGVVRPPNPYRVPGNYCNNAREAEPHQGEKEKARRRKQLRLGEYAGGGA